jgi:exodeoxyribonuclease VII small subunit
MANSERGSKESPPAVFEEELKRLQDVVARLEGGEFTLEEALDQFKAGCEAYRKCVEILRHARGRIEALARELDGEALVWEPFSFSPLEPARCSNTRAGAVAGDAGQ